MDRLLTVQQAAEFLSVHKSTVYRYTERNEIPHIRKRSWIRFRLIDLEKWIDQGRREVHYSDKNLTKILTSSSSSYIDKVKGGGELPKGKTKTRFNFGYGAIYQRKTSKGKIRWYIDYRDREGKRNQRIVSHAISREEAVIALKDAVLREHYEEYGVKEENKPTKFKEFVDMFIENYSKVNKKSWKDDGYRLQKFISFFGNIYLHEITPLEIEKFKSEKIGQGLSKTTVNHYLKILKRLFNVAIDWGYTTVNPVKRIKFYSEKDSLKERILTQEEEDRLLQAASERLRAILVVALHTGMRRREILDLNWEQIDFEDRLIKIHKAKSGKPRKVDINSILFDELLKLKAEKRNNPYVFCNTDTSKPLVTVRRSFENACRRAGIVGLRFHDLRHTFASRLIELGVDIIKVKELLGHSTVKITERYTHPGREEKRKAVELLCRQSPKKGKKREDLLHSCDMKKDEKESVFTSSLFSVN